MIKTKFISKSLYPYYDYDEYNMYKEKNISQIKSLSMIELWNKLNPSMLIKNCEG